MVSGRRGKQVAALYTANLLATLAGLGIMIVNTRLMTRTEFGVYKWVEFIFLFAATIATFGFFSSGARLLAQEANAPLKSQLTGGTITLAAIISVLMTAGLFVFSFFIKDSDGIDVARVVRWLCPFAFAFLLRLCLGAVLKGNNQILRLSLFRCSPQIMYLIVGASLLWGGHALHAVKLLPEPRTFAISPHTALFLRYIMLAAAVIVTIYYLKPSLAQRRESFRRLWRENSAYGFQAYLGILAGTATTQLGGVLVGAVDSTQAAGLFGLAAQSAMPLALLPGVVGTTFFRRFANMSSIPKRVSTVTIMLSLGALAAYLVIIGPVFEWLFPQYVSAVPLGRVIAVACTLQGLGGFVAQFLHAHGMGKSIRNALIFMGVVNIVGYLLLLGPYETMGVAVTRLLVSIAHLCLMCYYYYRFRTKLRKQSPKTCPPRRTS